MRRFSPRQLIKTPGRLSYHDMILKESGLVSYWNFGAGQGSKAWDQKGTNHGDITGATWTQKANGLWMLNFDENDYVDCGNDASLQLTELSIECWMYSEANDNGIISKGRSRGDIDLRDWDIFGNGTNLTLVISDGSAGIVGISGTYPSLNNWHHVVARWDGTTSTNGAKLYVDGKLLAQGDASATNNTNSYNVFIGGSELYAFDGSLNEVCIYNVVLSPATILKHYHVGIWEGLGAA